MIAVVLALLIVPLAAGLTCVALPRTAARAITVLSGLAASGWSWR